MFGRIALLFICFGLATGSVACAEPPGPVTFSRSDVTVATVGGARFHFTVDIAESDEQLHQGLMFRDTMPTDGGMLFLLGTEQVAAFWMRNTFLPLDMLFVARDGRITNVHHNAAPGSTAIITSTAPVTAVLELNAGIAARLGIHAGDRVLHSAFQ